MHFVFLILAAALGAAAFGTEGAANADCRTVVAVKIRETPELWWPAHGPEARHTSPEIQAFANGVTFSEDETQRFRRAFNPRSGHALAFLQASFRVAADTVSLDRARAVVLFRALFAQLLWINDALARGADLGLRGAEIGLLGSLLFNTCERWLDLHEIPYGRPRSTARTARGTTTLRAFRLSVEEGADRIPLLAQLRALTRGSRETLRFDIVPGSFFGGRRISGVSTADYADATTIDVDLAMTILLHLNVSDIAAEQLRRGLEMVHSAATNQLSPYNGAFFRPSANRGRGELTDFSSLYTRSVPEVPATTAPLSERRDFASLFSREIGEESILFRTLERNYREMERMLNFWLTLLPRLPLDAEVVERRTGVRHNAPWYSTTVIPHTIRASARLAMTNGFGDLTVSLSPNLTGVTVGGGDLHFRLGVGDDGLLETVTRFRPLLERLRNRSATTDERRLTAELHRRILLQVSRRLSFSYFLARFRVVSRVPVLLALRRFEETEATADYEAVLAATAEVNDPTIHRRSLRRLGLEPILAAPTRALPACTAEGTPVEPMHYLRQDYVAAAPGSGRNAITETLAIDAVIHLALSNGWDYYDVGLHQMGPDIILKDRRTGDVWVVEVKGRAESATDVTLTQNEVEFAVEHREHWLLALVRIDVEGNPRVTFLSQVPLAPWNELEASRVLSIERLLERSRPVLLTPNIDL